MQTDPATGSSIMSTKLIIFYLDFLYVTRI
jgi:hypothetical protein